MRKNHFLIFAVTIMLLWSFFNDKTTTVYGASETTVMKPIFDGNDGVTEPKLMFKNCKGWDEGVDHLNWGGKNLPTKFKKEFKSLTITYINEWWSCSNRIVSITRWYFEYPSDAALYPTIASSGILGSCGFPGWQPKADIGDNTYWLSPYIVIFSKDKTLVRIEVNSRVFGKDYTEKIARAIEKKL